jgi:hypothetical protein
MLQNYILINIIQYTLNLCLNSEKQSNSLENIIGNNFKFDKNLQIF